MKIYVIQEDPGDYAYDNDTMEEYWVSDKRPLIAFTTREKAEEYFKENENDLCVEIYEIELK